MELIKVVTPSERARLERRHDPEQLMRRAGVEIARRVSAKAVTLLAGTGNNGCYAYAAGLELMAKKVKVRAVAIEGALSPLNRKFRELFKKRGGKFTDAMEGTLLDGLQGEETPLIQQANQSGLPIIAIDIPSGEIVATETIALGLPKIGLFIGDGWEHVGKLSIADIGLDAEQARPVAYLPQPLPLPKILRTRHKYQTGYVVGFSGSKEFTGAPMMAGLAALRGGAGMVRIFHFDEIGPPPLELISSEWNEKAWKEALKKAKAVFVGPGLGSDERTEIWCQKQLKNIKVPLVVDADALLPNISYPKEAILTPHAGEAKRLLQAEPTWENISRFCARRKLIFILKGAPTFIFAPKMKPLIIARGDPGMAKAGSGDVLTGLIAAMLAQGCKPLAAAILGTTLHAMAGEIAAKRKTSYAMIATDLIKSLPAAFEQYQSKKRPIPSSKETEG
jgi:NAD(P)H-hydrate epimerase